MLEHLWIPVKQLSCAACQVSLRQLPESLTKKPAVAVFPFMMVWARLDVAIMRARTMPHLGPILEDEGGNSLEKLGKDIDLWREPNDLTMFHGGRLYWSLPEHEH